MEVSRRDIVLDKILPGKFLKVPIEQYLELLGIEAIPSQVALINAINSDKYRFIVGALSRRQGKTYIGNIIAQCVALVPGCHVLIVSPNYNLSNISFDLQRNLIKHFDLEVARDNAKDRVIELTNGSTVRLGSVNQIDSVVGRSYDFVLFDEAALADGETAFNVAIRPTLDKPGSKALFISTPRGRNNWFSRFFNRGFTDDFEEWVSIKQLGMITQELQKLILRKHDVLCQPQNLLRNTKQTLMCLKGRFGHLTMISACKTYQKWILQAAILSRGLT